ncbi:MULTISPECIES: CRISPR-associated endonuclease Cas2 [Micromonosporaceae]|uniref:CRISPR-associated endonuclease Cas2 n=1 Tax=Micromonosporaceae TaxID=28056 RepID=UPI002416B0C9|nr:MULTISPECIES: CRISPR-associated endonuclease Cas2 [unclassified Solwaraspora]MDG4765275.1 CRISPR-associated endonuclease Cas2 [Solwaraspora sp. WMMD406]MDG4771961.1 CRISPR-associated endonuclease Cas2 [Solwaraspora sp. WMMD792]WBB95028.1 CRISPR-associated endonuclease Cas2 [Solwaraspora sp. WMMA2059]WBC21089.1 CRISPR-associated endonuclease Cas2 [Solwaraspora sp. WMMA2080]WFE21063.1 CRISPR-associated endonuclease Cas2 [Solwaraspora sp. WMMD937]
MNRPVLVVYDIVNDRRRAEVRARLGPIADRFQYSGWLVPPEVNLTAARVVADLAAVAGPADRIHGHAPCPDCARRARWLPARQPHRLTRQPGWTAH